MATKFTTRCVMAGLTSFAIAATMSTGVASAGPRQGDPSWVDCAGPYVCTKYWSREETRRHYDDTTTLAWGAWRAALQTELVSIVFRREQVVLDNYEAALNDAVTYNGCVQFAWSKSGKGQGTWSYTTHPSYCYNQYFVYDRVGGGTA